MFYKQLEVRQLELEKLSDYHRQFLMDSLEQSTKNLRVIEGVLIVLANPFFVKVMNSRAITKAITSLLCKFWPDCRSLREQDRGIFGFVFGLSRFLGGLFGMVFLLVRFVLKLVGYILRSRAIGGKSGSQGRAKI